MKSTLFYLLKKCFDDVEMSIMSSLRGYRWEPPDRLVREKEGDVDDKIACTKAGDWYPRIIDILRHVVECDEMYMGQAYHYHAHIAGDSYSRLMERLEAVHVFMLETVNGLSELDLSRPVNTSCHGESANNLFAVLARHHVNHGAQIKVLRRYLAWKQHR